MAELDPVATLSSAVDDEASLQQARVILAGDPEAELDRLFGRLLKQHTLSNALHHLQRAGADLGRLTISRERFQSAFPLNLLIAKPEEVRPGRISVATILDRLFEHRAILRRLVAEVLDALPGVDMTLISGLGLVAKYRAMGSRHYNDADLFFTELEPCRQVLNFLLDKMRFAIERVRSARVDGRRVTHFLLTRQSAEGNYLLVELFVGGRAAEPKWIPPWSHPQIATRAATVEWEGRRVRVPTAEDIIFMIAEKTRRQRTFTRRDFNDMSFLLTEEAGRLDWDYLAQTVLDHQLGTALHQLSLEAESLAGRELVPRDALARIAPGFLEKKLVGMVPGTPAYRERSANGAKPPSRRFSMLWGDFWIVQHAGSRLTAPGAVADLVKDWAEANVWAFEKGTMTKALRRRLREIDPEIERFWWGSADFIHPPR